MATLLIAALAVASWFTTDTAVPGDAVQPSPAAEAPSPTARATTAPPVPATPTASPLALPALETLRIAIPRLGIDLPLAYGDITRDVPREGYAGGTPERVALVFPGSAPLDAAGNTYIYAHARVGMFLSLWDVRLSERVLIYAPDRPDVRLTYTVVRIAPRVSASDTSWLDPSGPERLTLQTSTGPNPGDPRFIVVAAREQAPPPGSAKPAGRD